MSIEAKKYIDFKRMFRNGEFPNQRLGQAFYNHFELHKINNQESLHGLYELDNDMAIVLINTLFEFN